VEDFTAIEAKEFFMQNVRLAITAALIAFASMLAHPTYAAPSQAEQESVKASADQTGIDAAKATLRDLWIGHVFWVRDVVIAELAGNTAARQEAEKQVVANAQAIAASIEPFYGADAKKKLFTLLAGHYAAVKAYLDASIAKQADKQTEATTALNGNASEIASFLSGANEYLPKDAVEGLLKVHGAHHIAQIQQLQAKDYAGEAQTWATITRHIYVIADALAQALAKQFPAKV
jgi:hypothetical protein